MSNIILRPGELHIVMAQLRCIGAYIENTGFELCWTEADIYGPATVKQILDGKHVKRGLEAHIITLHALEMLYQEALFKENETLAAKVDRSCENGSVEDVQQAQSYMQKNFNVQTYYKRCIHLTATVQTML